MFQHSARCGHRAKEGAPQTGVDDIVEVDFRHLEEWTKPGSSCVVDKDIKPSKPFTDRVNQLLESCLGTDVGLKGFRLAASLANRAAGALASFL